MKKATKKLKTFPEKTEMFAALNMAGKIEDAYNQGIKLSAEEETILHLFWLYRRANKD